jgi:hypothetical protein
MKVGLRSPLFLFFSLLVPRVDAELTYPQSSVVAARQSTKALTNSPRLFPTARGTKARSCSELSTLSSSSRTMSIRTLRSGHWRSYLRSKPSPS